MRSVIWYIYKRSWRSARPTTKCKCLAYAELFTARLEMRDGRTSPSTCIWRWIR